MKTSALRTWLRQERAKEHAAWLEGNPTTKDPHLSDEWTSTTQWFVTLPPEPLRWYGMSHWPDDVKFSKP